MNDEELAKHDDLRRSIDGILYSAEADRHLFKDNPDAHTALTTRFLVQLIVSRDQQIALAAQEKLLIEIAHDNEYRAESMNFLISRNAVIKKLWAVKAALKQEQEKV